MGPLKKMRFFYARSKREKEAVMGLIIRIFLLLFLFSSPSFSFTEQTTTERIINENRSFVDFINVSITNFGNQDKLDQFKDIYNIHFNGFVAFLQADYKRAYKKVYECQGKQVALYSDIVKNLYLEDSKDILDKLAPLVVRSKNAKSRLYLTLGYRDRTVGRNNFVVGMASNPKLHSYKLYKFMKAIKKTRRAKRYGLLALYESQTDEMKRKIYIHLLKNEQSKGNPFYNRFLGKTEDSYINEINKSYEEHQKTTREKDQNEEIVTKKEQIVTKKEDQSKKKEDETTKDDQKSNQT